MDKLTRRQFFARTGLGGLGLLSASSLLGYGQFTTSTGAIDQVLNQVNPGNINNTMMNARALRAYNIRTTAAQMELDRPRIVHQDNNDEVFYPNKIGNFHKTLPHNDFGEVDLDAYAALKTALTSGLNEDFEKIPQGGFVKLANPQAAFAYDLVGPDAFQMAMPHAPFLASHQTAGEMAEVYWHALLRDVPFADYATDNKVAHAAEELSSMTDFRGPTQNGSVTANTLFRGNTPGDLAGPYISQFLYETVPYGAQRIEQRSQTTQPGLNHMITDDNWLAVQNGTVPEQNAYLDQPRYISNGRDLGEFVHQDYPGQAYMNAALILMGKDNFFDFNNPYLNSQRQEGFVTFNISHVLKLVAGVVSCALKHAWFHKWLVNRRARPEAVGGLIQNHLMNRKASILPNELLFADVIQETFKQTGSFLLPMAYAEGSPAHPSYPAGHATLSGACATVLKAVFDEDLVLQNPVVASRDGSQLEPYRGSETLTVGGEINKLAANISLGRDFAGVHYRSDGIEGLLLGESIGLGILAELRLTYHEPFEGFTLTTFNGETITV